MSQFSEEEADFPTLDEKKILELLDQNVSDLFFCYNNIYFKLLM